MLFGGMLRKLFKKMWTQKYGFNNAFYGHLFLAYSATVYNYYSSNWLLTFNLHDKVTATVNRIAEQTRLFLKLNSKLWWALLRMNYKQETLINIYIYLSSWFRAS